MTISVNSNLQPDDRVFLRSRACSCAQCHRAIDDSMIVISYNHSTICLNCAGIETLVFLASGDPALTRRACKASSQSHVVWRFNKSRRRNERQGVLVESSALEKARTECEADEFQRERQKEKNTLVREKKDLKYQEAFAKKIRELYPNSPSGEENVIAAHATEKHSDRVGRAAAAKGLAPHAVKLAVRAHIRHVYTNYDELLNQGGYAKDHARQTVASKVDEKEARWK